MRISTLSVLQSPYTGANAFLAAGHFLFPTPPHSHFLKLLYLPPLGKNTENEIIKTKGEGQ